MKLYYKLFDIFLGGVLSPMYALIGLIIIAIILLVFTVAMGKLFLKAGERGWTIVVPIYRDVVWLRMADKPRWWIIFFILPLAQNVIRIETLIMLLDNSIFLTAWLLFYAAIFAFYVFVLDGIVKNFGKNTAWTLGCALLPFIFLPLLAWDKNVFFKGQKRFIDSHDATVLDSFGDRNVD